MKKRVKQLTNVSSLTIVICLAYSVIRFGRAFVESDRTLEDLPFLLSKPRGNAQLEELRRLESDLSVTNWSGDVNIEFAKLKVQLAKFYFYRDQVSEHEINTFLSHARRCSKSKDESLVEVGALSNEVIVSPSKMTLEATTNHIERILLGPKSMFSNP